MRLGDAVVRALWEDRLQRLWIGTEAGLYLRHSDGHMDQYTTQDGLPSDLVFGPRRLRGAYLGWH